MKKKTIVICSLVFACLATALWTGLEAHGAQRELAGKMIRLHVIANSDSQEDQDRKLTVRDAVLEQAEEILRQAEDVEEAQTRLEEALPALEAAAEETLRRQGCSDSVSASLSWERYPTREYATFRLPAGQYLSLRLTIGQGAGQNWWCVVFPPLCNEAAVEDLGETALEAGLTREEVRLITEETTGYQVRFKTVEWVEELLGWLG